MFPNDKRVPLAPPILGRVTPAPGLPQPGAPFLPGKPIEAKPHFDKKGGPAGRKFKPKMTPEQAKKFLLEKINRWNPGKVREEWVYRIKLLNTIAAAMMSRMPEGSPERDEWETRLILGKRMQRLRDNFTPEEQEQIRVEGRKRKAEMEAAKVSEGDVAAS